MHKNHTSNYKKTAAYIFGSLALTFCASAFMPKLIGYLADEIYLLKSK